jgi:hypothetical protein
MRNMEKNIKNAVFWDVAPCRSCVNRRLKGKHRLHLQGRKIRERGTSVSRWLRPQYEHSLLKYRFTILRDYLACGVPVQCILSVLHGKVEKHLCKPGELYVTNPQTQFCLLDQWVLIQIFASSSMIIS